MSCYHHVDKISDASVHYFEHESANEMNCGSKTYIYIVKTEFVNILRSYYDLGFLSSFNRRQNGRFKGLISDNNLIFLPMIKMPESKV